MSLIRTNANFYEDRTAFVHDLSAVVQLKFSLVHVAKKLYRQIKIKLKETEFSVG